MTKIMIVNNVDPTTRSVEIIDTNSTSASSPCAPIQDFPVGVGGSVGGLVDGNFPLVCGGGLPASDACYQFSQGTWTSGGIISFNNYFVTKMIYIR